jgi:hypothetical protein
MQRLQVELVDTLGRDKAHGGTLHGLGHGFSVAEVVLLALEEGLHELPRHQLNVVAEGEQLTAQMMGADTGLHADQARRHVSETNHHLAAGQPLP